MRACCTGVIRTSAAFSFLASILSALGLTRVTGRLSTFSLTGVARSLSALGLTGLASIITRSLSAPGSTGIASLIAGIASSLAGITRTRVAQSPAGVATGSAARAATAYTGETRSRIASSAAAAFGCAGRPGFRPEALLLCQERRLTAAAQPDVEIEIISSRSCFVRA